MKKRIKALNLFNRSDSCSYVRHAVPFSELRNRGSFIQDKWPINRMDFNIAILSRAISPDIVQSIVKMKAALGVKIVYDTDDLLFYLEPSNPYFSDVKTAMGLGLTKRLLPFVDMVTTATEPLAEEFRELLPQTPIRVLPNCVRPAEWAERPRKAKKIRIGYAGGSSHHGELNFILPIIAELQKRHDFEFHIFGIFTSLEHMRKQIELKIEGLDQPEVWQEMMKETEELLKTVKYKHHPYVDIDRYARTLADLDLDIGLCPLYETRFNVCKSAIKAYEFAMVGTLVLASDAEPYAGFPGLAEMDPQLWIESLELLLTASKEYREEVAANQKAYVVDNFAIEKNAHLWEDAYQELLQQPTTHHAVRPESVLCGPDGQPLRSAKNERKIIHA